VLTAYPIYYDPSLVVEHPYADSVKDYWRKMYRIERQKPYLWDEQGVPKSQQWVRIVGPALTPTKYLGRSLRHAVARSGGNVARTLGRIRGMYASGGEQ
jgi:hypothetical protein